MTPPDFEDLIGEARIVGARRVARRIAPYFEALYESLTLVEQRCGSMGVTITNLLFWDREFVNARKVLGVEGNDRDPELVFIYMHEVIHRYMRHGERRLALGISTRDEIEDWAQAVDVVDNEMCRGMFGGYAPQDALLPEEYDPPLRYNLTTEECYAELRRRRKEREEKQQQEQEEKEKQQQEENDQDEQQEESGSDQSDDPNTGDGDGEDEQPGDDPTDGDESDDQDGDQGDQDGDGDQEGGEDEQPGEGGSDQDDQDGDQDGDGAGTATGDTDEEESDGEDGEGDGGGDSADHQPGGKGEGGDADQPEGEGDQDGDEKDGDGGGGEGDQDGDAAQGDAGGAEGTGDQPAPSKPAPAPLTGQVDGSGSGAALEDEPTADHPAARDDAALDVLMEAVSEAIVDYAEKHVGSIPGGMLARATELLECSEVTWEQELRTRLRDACGTTKGNLDYRWIGRVSKKQWGVGGMGHGLPVLPTPVAPDVRLDFVIDTSGSMCDDDLTACKREVAGIIETLNGASMHIVAIDTRVQAEGDVRTVEDIDAQQLLRGRGGTDFCPYFVALMERPLHERPNIIVFATDGYGAAPDIGPPGIETIWLMVGDGARTMPFAESGGWSDENEITWGDAIRVPSTKRPGTD